MTGQTVTMNFTLGFYVDRNGNVWEVDAPEGADWVDLWGCSIDDEMPHCTSFFSYNADMLVMLLFNMDYLGFDEGQLKSLGELASLTHPAYETLYAIEQEKINAVFS